MRDWTLKQNKIICAGNRTNEKKGEGTKKGRSGLREAGKRCLPTNRKVSFGPNNFAFLTAFYFALPAFTFLILFIESPVVNSDISQIRTATRKALFVTGRFDTSGQGSLRKRESWVEEMSV